MNNDFTLKMSPLLTHTKRGYQTEVKCLIFLLTLLLIIEVTHFDTLLADHVYAWMGHAWIYRNHFWTQWVLHDFAKRVIEGGFLLFLGLIVLNRFFLKKRAWLDFELAAINTLVGALIIGLLKATTHVHCPWDLSRYGGNLDTDSMMNTIASPLSSGNCFPGGHASTAYCFLAFYFVLKHLRPQLAKAMLWISLLLGLVFDVTQQIRGAHFASHGLWSLAIIWSYNLLFMLLFGATIRARMNKAAPQPR